MSEGDDSTWPPPPPGPSQPSRGALPALGVAPLPFRGRKPPALDPIPNWLNRSMDGVGPALGSAAVLSGAGVVAWLVATLVIGYTFPLLAVVLPNASEPVRFGLQVIPTVVGGVFFTAAAHTIVASHLGYQSSVGRSLQQVLERLGPVLLVLIPLAAVRLLAEMWAIRLLFRGPSPGRLVFMVAVVIIAARLLLALVSAVIGPRDQNPYGHSWRLTSGGFVPMLRRTLVLVGMVVAGTVVARSMIMVLLTTPTSVDPTFDLYLAFTVEAVMRTEVLIVVHSALADLYLQTGGEGDL